MKKTALALALFTLPVYANTHVYECEMSVAEVKKRRDLQRRQS